MTDPLKPQAVPAPAPSAYHLRPDQLPGQGRPPLRAGAPVMSDMVRRNLEQIGWKDGDPIPGDLGKILQDMRNEVEREKEEARLEDSELAAGWTPPKVSFVQIEDLPEDKQNELRAYLAEHKQEIQEQREFAEAAKQADAQIPDNVVGPQREVLREGLLQSQQEMAAREARAATPQGGGIIDDRETAGFREPPKSDPPPAPAAPPAATAAPATGAPEAAIADHVHCPRCNWKVNQAYDLKVSEHDKRVFLAGLLGTKHFEKRIELLGGNLAITFRSLTSEETHLISAQLRNMVESGAIRGNGEYLSHVMEFRTALATAKIETGGGISYQVSDIKQWASDNPGPADKLDATPLPRFVKHFYAHAVPQEYLRRIIGQQYQKFQRLVEFLEVMSDEPDFYNGIEPLA